MIFFFTFGQNHPLRDNWIEIDAPCKAEARDAMMKIWGDKWSFVYSEQTWKPEFFEGGKVGRTIEVGP